MKLAKLIGLVIAFFSFASCNNPAPTNNSATHNDSTNNMASKTERNKKIIMACMDAFNNHDTGKMFKNLAPDFTEYESGYMSPQKGDSAKQSVQMFFTSFPDAKAENKQYCADGNMVMVLSDCSQTFKNDMGAIKATGKTAKYQDVDIFTLDDNGKITSHRSIYPTSAMMEQLGVDMSKMQAMSEKKKG